MRTGDTEHLEFGNRTAVVTTSTTKVDAVGSYSRELLETVVDNTRAGSLVARDIGEGKLVLTGSVPGRN